MSAFYLRRVNLSGKLHSNLTVKIWDHTQFQPFHFVLDFDKRDAWVCVCVLAPVVVYVSIYAPYVYALDLVIWMDEWLADWYILVPSISRHTLTQSNARAHRQWSKKKLIWRINSRDACTIYIIRVKSTSNITAVIVAKYQMMLKLGVVGGDAYSTRFFGLLKTKSSKINCKPNTHTRTKRFAMRWTR